MAKLLVYNGKLVTNSGRLVSYSGSTPPTPAKLAAPEVVSAPYLATIGYNLNNEGSDVREIVARVRLRSSMATVEGNTSPYDNSFYVGSWSPELRTTGYDDTAGSYMLPLHLAVSAALNWNGTTGTTVSPDRLKMYIQSSQAWNLTQSEEWSADTPEQGQELRPVLIVDGAGNLALGDSEEDVIVTPSVFGTNNLNEILQQISLRSYNSHPEDPESELTTGNEWYLTDDPSHGLLVGDYEAIRDWDIIEISLKAISRNSQIADSDWSMPFNVMNNSFYNVGQTYPDITPVMKPYASLHSLITLRADASDFTENEHFGSLAYCFDGSTHPFNSWAAVGYTIGDYFVFNVPLLEEEMSVAGAKMATGLIPGGMADLAGNGILCKSVGCIAFIPSDHYDETCPYTSEEYPGYVYMPRDAMITVPYPAVDYDFETYTAYLTDHEYTDNLTGYRLNLLGNSPLHKLGAYQLYDYVPYRIGTIKTSNDSTDLWNNPDVVFNINFNDIDGGM